MTLSELEMENAIAAEPEKFLGETGLRLVARQYRLGPYIFDLLFEDRHGAKMIVEVQFGTLDRNHTYKILDYYHQYKEKHVGEFVELMVVSNMITHERRKRLDDLGVNWREIPIEKFLLLDSTKKESQGLVRNLANEETFPDIEKPSAILVRNSPRAEEKSQNSHETIPVSYIRFKEQTKLFIEKLDRITPPVRLTVDGRNVSPYKRNWFSCFAPISWGRKMAKSSAKGSGYGKGVGVDYGFIYTTNRDGSPFVRLEIGIEKPFKQEFRNRFREEIAESTRSLRIPLPMGCHIWPDTKLPNFRFHGTSILECQPLSLEQNTWMKALDNYKILTESYNEVVDQLLRKYYAEGAFEVEIKFD